jgi:Uma2 family endonuclease
MTALINPPVRRMEMLDAELPRWTHDDFMRLAPEDEKAELIEGVLLIMPPPSDVHERLQNFLLKVIGLFVDYFRLGEVRGSRTAVRIAARHVYEPDILFVRRDRRHIITNAEVLEAPDLVVEILSPSTADYDRGAKREHYAAAGVRELWLIDPYGPAGTQFFQRQNEALVEVAPIAGVIHSLALPNFKLQIAWLWPDEQGELPNAVTALKELGVL